METTKRQKPWRAVLLRILGYVAIMSVYENVAGENADRGWRLIPAGCILGLLLLGMRRKLF